MLAVADGAWALGTVAVVAAGLLAFPGGLLALAVAAVTAGFAVTEDRAAAEVRQPRSGSGGPAAGNGGGGGLNRRAPASVDEEPGAEVVEDELEGIGGRVPRLVLQVHRQHGVGALRDVVEVAR